jgi:hypothetical protein
LKHLSVFLYLSILAGVCYAQGDGLQPQPDTLAPADVAAAPAPAPASVAKDLFSPGTFGETLAASVSDQLRHFPSQWGDGVTGGFQKRLASEYGQVVLGNLIQSAVQKLHNEDPRYFRRGHGNFFARTFYVIENTLVVHATDGTRTVSLSLPAEAYGSWGIASLWYPTEDRGIGSFFRYGSANIGVKVAGNFFHEFWPDVKSAFRHH